MAGKLCLFCCHTFHSEVAAGVAEEDWDDVVTAPFPARCGRPPVNWDELRPLLPNGCTQVAVLGRACLRGLGVPPSDFPKVRLLSAKQCFHWVAGETLVDETIGGGGYLMTPSWLADWRSHIRELGFDPYNSVELADFFRESASEMVLLDTGRSSHKNADTDAQLAALQATVQLPVRRVTIGLETLRLKLARPVLEWRLAQEQQARREYAQRHVRELADHLAAMDILVRLARTQIESEAITAIEDLFRILFAPGSLYYLRVVNDVPVSEGQIPAPLLDAMRALRGDHARSPDGRGFLLRIASGEDTLGIIALEEIASSQSSEHYLNMALALTGVCGLVIDNARNRKRLIESEKMAALGVLIAGVAHEINTPLGVGLAAASMLRERSRRLAERFDARSMTQSELTHYFETTQAGTELLCQNLERIGNLIDAFRQVAVDGKTSDKARFRLRDCIDDVIRSLGDQLLAAGIPVQIDCDPALEIEGVASDWGSIFVNLIVNSLKHGFKDRAQGSIATRIVSDAKRLRVDYRDDGCGMDATTRARIFDPFFTTDLQHGMGLGMHLVYNLVTHRMGGNIQCDSQRGYGAHFVIEIPQ
ncbi:sensor histidine kinase [Azoarcus sp. KH32C]|uniref:sensor histidine kinase n=1 Tax=Azoarcus sp. KH32C TaxID=748247 RepID=UPI0002385DCE|nr:ATP-binding protein [Azoarcus sp. KH32C]BAL27132.1 putative histidine kinase [Azoarcus sp. KH32C]